MAMCSDEKTLSLNISVSINSQQIKVCKCAAFRKFFLKNDLGIYALAFKRPKETKLHSNK